MSLHIFGFKQIRTVSVLARLVSEAVSLHRIVGAGVSANSRVRTSRSGLRCGAIRDAVLVLAEILINTGVILLLADALLRAGDFVAFAALDGGAQTRGFTASGSLTELPAVLGWLLDVAGAVLGAAATEFAAS